MYYREAHHHTGGGHAHWLALLGLVIGFISLFVEWTVLAGSATSLAQLYFELLYALFGGFGIFGALLGQGLTVTTLPQLATLLTLFAIPIGLVWRRGIILSAGALLWMYASAATLTAIFIGPLVALAGGIIMSSGDVAAIYNRRKQIYSALVLIVAPLVIGYILYHNPSITYNSKIVFQTAAWKGTITVNNYNCPISPLYGQCPPSPQYNVSGFYYVNATAKNTTCWVNSIVNLSRIPNQTLALNSPDSNAVINYMNNQYIQTNCNSQTGYTFTHHYAAV